MRTRPDYLKDQIFGAAVQAANAARNRARDIALESQDALKEAALRHLDGVRAFAEDPSRILGSNGTKHGEMQEVSEVGIRNAYSFITGGGIRATFDGTTRTGAFDFFIDGKGFQSKFYNKDTRGVRALVEYLEKYPDLADKSGLMLPADRYQKIISILNDPSIEKQGLRNAVSRLEELTGKPFTEAVTPSVSNYSDVQLGNIDQTIDTHEAEIEGINEDIKEKIKAEHEPSLSGAAEAAAIAGVVSAGINIGVEFYKKFKAGRNVFQGQFTKEDWRDVGIAGGKGAAAGALTGGGLYALTNYADMSAPFAAAIISAAKGLGDLTYQYHNGKISFNEFVDMGMCVCAESSIVGIATVAGQAIIPIPVIGGLIGSVAGRMMLGLATGLDAKEQDRIKKKMDDFIANLDKTHHDLIEALNAEFDALGELTKAAFDFELNYRLTLVSSVDLAIAHGVPKHKILTSVSDVDDFMMG